MIVANAGDFNGYIFDINSFYHFIFYTGMLRRLEGPNNRRQVPIMAKIFRKTHNPYVLCAVTHSLTLKIDKDRQLFISRVSQWMHIL